MGCTSSSEGDFLLQMAALREEMEQQRLKSHEQQNLLRFKVEVLVNMLAVEEKRAEENAKRTETLQWLLAKNGITEDSLNALLLNMDAVTREQVVSSIASAKVGDKLLLPDVSSVVEKMREEFSAHRDDILHAFSRSDGKVVSVLAAEVFVKQLCEVTENISPPDAKVLALRFDDGTGGFVSVTEFMDFFITPPSVRTARAAASAVRMSLELFSLNVEMLDNIKEEDEDQLLSEEELDSLPVELRKTHYTDILDRGAKRLLVMWTIVRSDLSAQLQIFAKKNEVEKVIEIDIFKNALETVCGPYSELLDKLCVEGKIAIKIAFKTGQAETKEEEKKSDADGNLRRNAGSTPKQALPDKDKKKDDKASSGSDESKTTDKPSTATDSKAGPADPHTPPPASANSDSKPADANNKPLIEPLSKEDIEFLAERFELAGLIHYGHFFEFFDSTHARFVRYQRRFKTLPEDVALSASPFTYSSEWNALKASSLLRTSKQQIMRTSRSLSTNNNSKTFTAPKQLPPPAPKPVETPKPPSKPPKRIEETPALPEKKEEEEKEKSDPPPVAEEKKEGKEDAETTEVDEKKEEEKKGEEPKKEDKPTAPVVQQSGCFFCSLGSRSAQPQPQSEPKALSSPAPAVAEDKGAKRERDTPLHKQTPPPRLLTDVDDKEDKPELPPMKHSASPRGFRAPRSFDAESTSSDDTMMRTLPQREGLGHGRNDDTPVVQPRNKGSRFRRREGQDFAHEKKIEEEPDELEEDQRYGGKR